MSTKIVGNTVYSDSYAPGPVVITGPPDRYDPTPEEREREREADKIEREPMLQKLGWTVQQYETARDFHNFPKGLQGLGRGWGAPRPPMTFSRRKVNEWIAQSVALISPLGGVRL
jgi:hypothetical protein